MQRWRLIIGASLLLGGALAGVASSGAQAGVVTPTGELQVFMQVAGLEAANIDDMVIEVYTPGGVLVSECSDLGIFGSSDDVLVSQRGSACQLAAGSYQLGVSNQPAGYVSNVFCSGPSPIVAELIDGVDSTFTINGGSRTQCSMYFGTTTLAVFKDVVDLDEIATGPLAAPTDFTIEVFDDAGALFVSGPIAAQDGCGYFDETAPCFVTDLPDGNYTIGEGAVYGYVPIDLGCSTSGGPDEQLPDSLSPDIFAEADPFGVFTDCTLTNLYSEGSVSLTHTVTNDDGGAAALGDFTLELFRTGDGTPVATGVCVNTGVCLEGSFPVGDYVVGQSGPSGYANTVTQTITEPNVLNAEALADPNAAFTLDRNAIVEVEVASDDIATTTTTTTVLPTTTQLATTTSALNAAAATLPQTGSTDQTSTLAVLAIVMLLLGGSTLLLSRRRP